MTREEAIKELKEDRALYESDVCWAGDGTPDGQLMLALDMAIESLSEPYWHTGEPTEEGWYLILYGNGYPDVLSFNEVKHIYKQLTAWHKIPPYEEQK